MNKKYKIMEETANTLLAELEKSLQKVEQGQRKEFLKSLENDILATNNLDLFYKLISDGNWSTKVDVVVYRNAIIESRDPKYNYLATGYFLYNDEHEIAVLESKNPEYNYLFSRNVRGANQKAHAKVVLESKDPKYNYLYMQDVPNAKKKAHGKVIIESKDLEHNYLALTLCYNYSAFCKHLDVILKSKDPEYNCRAAVFLINHHVYAPQNWNNMFIQKRKADHIKIVLDSKDAKSNFELATECSYSTALKCIKIIIQSKDLEYNYRMAIKNNAYLSEHAQVIIDSKNLEYNYLFAKNVKGANIEDHREVFLEAQKRSYIEETEKKIIDKFLQEFPMNDYSDEMTNVKSFIKKYKFN